LSLILEIEVRDDATAKIKRWKDSTTQAHDKVGRTAKESAGKQERAADRVKSSLDKLKKAYFAVAAGVAAVGAAIGKAVTSTADYRDEVAKLSKATGLSTEALSGFRYAAEIGGSSAEGFSKGLRTLIMRMGDVQEGLATSKRAFNQLGVDVLDSTGALRPAEQVMLDVADAMSGMTNDTEKAALAQEIFGRSGLELVPMLSQGSGAIKLLQERAETLGLTFSEVEGQQAEDFNDSLTNLKGATMGLAQAIGSILIPHLTKMFTHMAAGIIYTQQFMAEQVEAYGKTEEEIKNNEKALKKYATAFDYLANPQLVFIDLGRRIGKAIKGSGREAETAEGRFKSFGSILEELNTQFETVGSSIESLSDGGLENINEGLEDTIDTLAESEQSWRNYGITVSGVLSSMALQMASLDSSSTDMFLDQLNVRTDAVDSFMNGYQMKMIDTYDRESALHDNRMVMLALWQTGLYNAAGVASEFFGSLATMQLTDLQIALQTNAAAKQSLKDRFEAGKISARDYEAQMNKLTKNEEKQRKEQGAKYKAFAIAQTVADTYRAAQGSHAALANIPYVGPALGIAAAAAAVASGLARVGQIKAQQFRQGGIVEGGPMLSGTGEVMIGATPGEGIVNRRGMERLGADGLEALNRGRSLTNNVTLNVVTREISDEYIEYSLAPRLRRILARAGA